MYGIGSTGFDPCRSSKCTCGWSTVPVFPGEQWRDKIDLRRWHYSSFEVPGAAGPIISAFESGWYADIEIH